jgi:CRISPR-associated protein Cmx8
MTDVSSVDDNTRERVYKLVQTFVFRKTETKSGIKWDDFRNKKVKDPNTNREKIDVPQRYRETRERICTDAFLRLRACHAKEDFVSYFTGTICSVPHYLPETEYQALANAILSDARWEEVKALAMLALSSFSRI